jgi:hypothetical protein
MLIDESVGYCSFIKSHIVVFIAYPNFPFIFNKFESRNKRQTRQFLLKSGMTNLHRRNQNLSTFIEFYFERQILALIIVLSMRGDLATE